jgi:hypothetical protein
MKMSPSDLVCETNYCDSYNRTKIEICMPPKRVSVKVAQWFWWNDSEWVPYTAEQNESLEQNRAVSPRDRTPHPSDRT